VLSNLLGNDIERGELPNDLELIGGMVRNICFRNARDYLRLNLDESHQTSTGAA
jgi:glucuronate isomerase